MEIAIAMQTQRFGMSWNRDVTNKDFGSYPGTTGWTRILFVLAQEQISRVLSCWEGYPDLHALRWPLMAESQARVHSWWSSVAGSLTGACLPFSHLEVGSDKRKQLWELQELSSLVWLIPLCCSLGVHIQQK